MTLALTPPTAPVRLTRIQRDFLSKTALLSFRGKSIYNAEDACAASSLARLGFVRIDTHLKRVLPTVFATSAGLGWLADDLMRTL